MSLESRPRPGSANASLSAVALVRLRRKREVETGATAVGADPTEETTGFPRHALSGVMDFLGPVFRGDGRWLGDRPRNFVQEAERKLRLQLDWSRGAQGASESLLRAMSTEPGLMPRVVDLALKEIAIGYPPNACEEAALELDRVLRDSGAEWKVSQVSRRLDFSLERRIDAATSAALDALASEQEPAAVHLAEARNRAYGQHPDAGKAYDEAVKAVEAAVINVVIPNDPTATLGKAIGVLRADPKQWKCTFTRATGDGQSPVEVVIGMLDMLWRNETERHSPVTPITLEQAESAVHVALSLVQLFRSGAVVRA